jgi:hypothetical protein
MKCPKEAARRSPLEARYFVRRAAWHILDHTWKSKTAWNPDRS